MTPVSLNQIRNLNADSLAARIDEFLNEAHNDRFCDEFPSIHVVTAKEILQSRKISLLPESERRRALLLFYRAAFQIAVCEEYTFAEIKLVLTPLPSDHDWHRPKLQIARAAFRQAAIVSARASFECLMEFVYLVETLNLIPGSRSKVRTFRKWLCLPGNTYGWLVYYLIVMRRFDRDHRTPEIHGTSYVAVEALRCEGYAQADTEIDGLNLNINIWNLVLDTLENRKFRSYSVSSIDSAVFSSFMSWQTEDLDALWKTHTSHSVDA